MRIKVYQIDEKKDLNQTKFLWYEYAMRKAGRIDPAIYRLAFAGNVGRETLDGVFDLFNTRILPKDFHGHSLSVSDIVEVCDRTDGMPEPGFYFCDSVGWRKLVDFDPTKATPLQAG